MAGFWCLRALFYGVDPSSFLAVGRNLGRGGPFFAMCVGSWPLFVPCCDTGLWVKRGGDGPGCPVLRQCSRAFGGRGLPTVSRVATWLVVGLQRGNWGGDLACQVAFWAAWPQFWGLTSWSWLPERVERPMLRQWPRPLLGPGLALVSHLATLVVAGERDGVAGASHVATLARCFGLKAV